MRKYLSLSFLVFGLGLLPQLSFAGDLSCKMAGVGAWGGLGHQDEKAWHTHRGVYTAGYCRDEKGALYMIVDKKSSLGAGFGLGVDVMRIKNFYFNGNRDKPYPAFLAEKKPVEEKDVQIGVGAHVSSATTGWDNTRPRWEEGLGLGVGYNRNLRESSEERLVLVRVPSFVDPAAVSNRESAKAHTDAKDDTAAVVKSLAGNPQ